MLGRTVAAPVRRPLRPRRVSTAFGAASTILAVAVPVPATPLSSTMTRSISTVRTMQACKADTAIAYAEGESRKAFPFCLVLR